MRCTVRRPLVGSRLRHGRAALLCGALTLAGCIRAGFGAGDTPSSDGANQTPDTSSLADGRRERPIADTASEAANDGSAALGRFGPPELIAELADADVGVDDPTLPADQLEIFFNKELAKADHRLYVSRRASLAGPWEAPHEVAALSTGLESNPAISSDGLTLYFSRDAGRWEIMVATRVARDAPWGTPSLLPQLNSGEKDLVDCVDASDRFLVLSSDRAGQRDVHDLLIATRASSSEPWGAPSFISELNTADGDWSGWINAGATVIYFVSDRPGGAGGTDIYRAQRQSAADPFDPPVLVQELNSAEDEDDPWLSPDGRTIYFSSARSGIKQLYRATRL